MDKKLKTALSLFGGLGAAGLIHRVSQATKGFGGGVFIDSAILAFEAVVFIGGTLYTNTVLNAVTDAFDKASKEEMKEDGEEVSEDGGK